MNYGRRFVTLYRRQGSSAALNMPANLEKTDDGRDWGQEEKGTTEDERAGWHH